MNRIDLALPMTGSINYLVYSQQHGKLEIRLQLGAQGIFFFFSLISTFHVVGYKQGSLFK